MSRTILSLVLALLVFRPAPGEAQDASTKPPRLDLFGDPLPTGALARLGTQRFACGGAYSYGTVPAAYSPDGKIIAAQRDQAFCLLDAVSGKVLRLLPFRAGFVAQLIFSQDGKKLAVVGLGAKSVALWDVHNSRLLFDVKNDPDSAFADDDRKFVFVHDGKTLVEVTKKSIFHWNVASGERRAVPFQFELEQRPQAAMAPANVAQPALPPPPFPAMPAFQPRRDIVCSADGKLAAMEQPECVCIVDTATGKLLQRIRDDLKDIAPAAFSKNGNILAVRGHLECNDPKLPAVPMIYLWDLAAGQRARTLLPAGTVASLAISGNGKMLAALTINRDLKKRDGWAREVELWDLTNHKASPRRIAARDCQMVMFSPDSASLVCGCWSSLWLFDPLTGKQRNSLPSHTARIFSLSFFADGQKLATAGGDGTVRIWEAATGKPLRKIDCEGRPAYVTVSQDGQLLAFQEETKCVRKWSADGREVKTGLTGDKDACFPLGFSPNGKLLASTSDKSDKLLLRDVASGETVFEHDCKDVDILRFAADSTKFAAIERWRDEKGDYKYRVHIVNLQTRKNRVHPLAETPCSLAFSPDGRTLALGFVIFNRETALLSETLTLMDVDTGNVVKKLPGKSTFVGDVAFSRDGRYLAAVCELSGKRSVKVFELSSAAEIRTVVEDSSIYGVAFSPDGTRLATWGTENTAIVWDAALERISAAK